MLSDEQIKQFQALYKDAFGLEISKEEALNKGTKLVRLFELVYQPITKEQYNKYKNYEITGKKI